MKDHLKHHRGTLLLILALVVFLVVELPAQVSVLTQCNTAARTAWNNQETILNTSNVNVTSFGKLFALSVDGYLYAQPLYVPGVPIPNKGVHNVVYVATEHNSVYAFDADDPSVPVLWKQSLNAGGTPVNSNDVCAASGNPNSCADLIPVVGITATPVIDQPSQTMYVVAETSQGGSYHFKLHALDITTGVERPGSPVEITSPGSMSPAFSQLPQLNRPGLLLLNGRVYTAFGSNGDFLVWHGWIFAYDATTLAQVAALDLSPNTGYQPGAGVWQGGKGLVSDGTSIYIAASNGSFSAGTGGTDYASSYVKLDQNLNITDYFAPGANNEQAYLNTNPGNVDIGAGGAILLPTTPPEIAGGGKDGILRVVNTTNMGRYNTSIDQNVQTFQATNAYPNGMIFGGPALWTSPQNGPVLYLWGPGDVIKGWKLVGNTFQTGPVTAGKIMNVQSEDTLAALSISSNGSQAGSGIVWASRFAQLPSGADIKVAPGVLTAFDADNLSNELWDSNQNSNRDAVNEYAKFVPPTVANGKVYLASWVGQNFMGSDSGQLLVYGLLSSVKQAFSLSSSPASATVSPGQSAQYTISVSSSGGFNGPVQLSCSSLPTGAQCQFAGNPVSAGGTTTLTLTTQAPSTASLRSGPRQRHHVLLGALYCLWLPPLGLALAGGLGSRRRRWLLALFSVLALTIFLASCGGGSSSPPPPPPPTGGTPAGSYSVVVSGTSSAGSQQFTTVNLKVQ